MPRWVPLCWVGLVAITVALVAFAVADWSDNAAECAEYAMAKVPATSATFVKLAFDVRSSDRLAAASFAVGLVAAVLIAAVALLMLAKVVYSTRRSSAQRGFEVIR